MAQTVSVSAGRDYTTYNHYEFCVFENENVVARKGGFSSNAAARKARIKVATDYIAREG